jgi:flagellar motor switch protein FliG
MKTDIHIWLYPAEIFSEWEMFQTKVVEKIKTHIFMFNNLFFFRKSCGYEIMWKNIDSDIAQMAI